MCVCMWRALLRLVSASCPYRSSTLVSARTPPTTFPCSFSCLLFLARKQVRLLSPKQLKLLNMDEKLSRAKPVTTTPAQPRLPPPAAKDSAGGTGMSWYAGEQVRTVHGCCSSSASLCVVAASVDLYTRYLYALYASIPAQLSLGANRPHRVHDVVCSTLHASLRFSVGLSLSHTLLSHSFSLLAHTHSLTHSLFTSCCSQPTLSSYCTGSLFPQAAPTAGITGGELRRRRILSPRTFLCQPE